MPKLFLLFLIIISFYSCNTKKDIVAKPIILAQLDTSLPKDRGLWLLAAEKRLQIISAVPDSLTSFVMLNDLLYDSVKKWKGNKGATKYQENIIGIHDKIAGDISLKKILAKAYVWWSFDYYTFSYNDTTVSRLEKFLLLTRDQQPADPMTIYAYQLLAIQYNVLGDLKKCGYYHSKFSTMAKAEGNADWYASGVSNLSIALNELGLYDSSINIIRLILKEKGINPKRTAGLYANLAEAEAGKKDFAASLASAKKSLEITDLLTKYEIDSTDLMALKYQLRWNIGDLQLQAQHTAEAELSLKKALGFLMTFKKGDLKNRESGKLFISIGRMFELNGKLPEALSNYQKALYCVTTVDSSITTQLPNFKDLYIENTIMEALDAKAGVLQKLYNVNNDIGYLQQAVQCYSLAFGVENKLTRGFSYDESLLRQTKESKGRSEKAIAACYELFKKTKSFAWAEKAFLFAEKSKALVLQESIRRNTAANGLLQNDTNWRHVQRYQQLVYHYEKEIATGLATDTIRNNQLKAQLAIAENDLLFAKTALVRSNSSYRDMLLKTDSLSAGLIYKDLLNDNTALVEFFFGDSSNYIFSFSKNQPIGFLKTEPAVNATLTRFLLFFTDKNKINNQPAAYQETAFQLYQQIGFYHLQNSTLTNLIIIPDGRFNFVPFEALVTAVSNSASPKNFAYLLQQKQIDYGYSAAILLKQLETQNEATADKLIAFAPIFAEEERNMVPLIHAEEEMNAMQKDLPSGKYFIKKEATLAHFKNEIADAGVVHIASHASAGSDNGMQPHIEFYDSTFYLSEIYAMRMRPGLVVLSACQTGLGVLDKSEGAMSLARGFYYAGAQNVITSLWNVDDRSTAGIFGDFYQHLSGGNYAGALYQAKLNYIKDATAANASPYYWAGFIHIGHQKQSPKNHNLLILISSLLVVSLIIFLLYRRRKQ